MEEINKTLILKNEISEISLLSDFIEEIGEKAGLEMPVILNLNMVLEEAVSNVILYGYPNKDIENISVNVRTNNNMLIFTITDKGIPFDPTKVPDVDTTISAEERSIGGLGIFLIKKIMNEVEYQRIDGKNIFTLKKVIKPNL